MKNANESSIISVILVGVIAGIVLLGALAAATSVRELHLPPATRTPIPTASARTTLIPPITTTPRP